jgi:hypothetical protein
MLMKRVKVVGCKPFCYNYSRIGPVVEALVGQKHDSVSLLSLVLALCAEGEGEGKVGVFALSSTCGALLYRYRGRWRKTKKILSAESV